MTIYCPIFLGTAIQRSGGNLPESPTAREEPRPGLSRAARFSPFLGSPPSGGRYKKCEGKSGINKLSMTRLITKDDQSVSF